MRYSLSILVLVLFASRPLSAPVGMQGNIVASGLPCRDGLILWLSPFSGFWSDAGYTPATLSGTVQQWSDFSGKANHATSGSSKLTSDWRSLFELDGFSTFLVPTLSVNKTNYTILALGRQYSQLDGGGSILSFNGFTPSLFDNFAAGPDLRAFAYVDGQRFHTNFPYVGSMVFGLVGNSASTAFYCETLVSSAASTGGVVTGAQIADFYQNVGFKFKGKLTHILVWNRALNATEVASVSRWMIAFEPHQDSYQRKIVCTGDSITAGFRASDVLSYPYQLQQLEGARSRVFNVGVSNKKIGEVATGSVYYSPGITNFCVVLAGINDLMAGTNGADCYSGILSFSNARASEGFKPVVLTVPTALTLTSGQDSNRVVLNNLILSNSSNFFAVVDIASDSRLTNAANATYFSDGLHLTAAGYGVVASLVSNGLP